MLSAHQIESFYRDGYLLIENGVSDTDLQPVIDEYNRVVDDLARDLKEKGKIECCHETEGFETRLARLCADDEATYRDADRLVDINEVIGKSTFDFLRNDNLLDLIEGILGPEITCSPIQHVRCKLPSSLWDGASSYTAPWHQDAQVHTEEADECFILTVWIPLVDTDERNGCLQVIPEVHRSAEVLWSEGFGISEENMPARNSLSLPMTKGDVLFVHKFTPHGSGPNETERMRWSLDLRYQITGTPSGRPWYPNFIARSRSNPSSELKDGVEWQARWKQAGKNPQKELIYKMTQRAQQNTPVTQIIRL